MGWLGVIVAEGGAGVEDGETAVCLLEGLAVRVEKEGWRARVTVSATVRPSLRVTNPEAPALNDDVRVERNAKGIWVFVLSWGAYLADADDADGAVLRLRRVLGLDSSGVDS